MKLNQLIVIAASLLISTGYGVRAEEPSDKGKAGERQRARAVEDNKRKAKAAWEKDKRTYKREELAALEELYQKANTNPRTPENQGLLKEVIKKYPKSNRAGCAACYLGQFSKNSKDAEKYLELAIREYSGCYYLNGTSVGGWARLLLAGREKQSGSATKAKKLFEEIRKDYRDATNHSGELLVTFLDDE